MPAPSTPADEISVFIRTGPRILVRYLIEHPNSYYGEIREGTGTAISSLTRDLGLLEKIGVVHTDVSQPPGDRRGRAPRYRVDEERLDTLLNDLRSQLFG